MKELSLFGFQVDNLNHINTSTDNTYVIHIVQAGLN